MQGKGLIRFFAIALTVVAIYQLSFTFFASKIGNEAEQFAIAQVASMADGLEKNAKIKEVKKEYLNDKMDEKVYPILGYTYKDCVERQLNLGLDLQGGMSVVLQVSLEGLIRSMSNDNPDKTFTQALVNATEAQKNSTVNFVDLFGQEFEKIAPQGARMSGIFSASPEYSDRIKPNSTNAEVLEVIRQESKDAVNRTYEILRARIDKFGVSQPNIQLQEANNRIIVELPGIDDPERVRKNLQATAQLEFWEVKELDNDLASIIGQIAKAVQNKEDAKKALENPKAAETETETETETEIEIADVVDENSDSTSLLNDDGSLADSNNDDSINPFYEIFSPGQGGSPVCGYVNVKDTAKYSKIMAMPEVRAAIPKNVKLLFGNKTINDLTNNDGDAVSGLIPVYAIESQFSDFKPPLDGGVITEARQNIDHTQQVIVEMAMNKEGGKKWKKLTKENIGQCVAIVMDDKVYSAPVVNTEISGGRSQITGDFSIKEAQDLASIIKIGKLPAPARIVQEETVGPTLGQESIRKGLTSLLIGVLLVMLFMMAYYNKGGVISVLALIANLVFIIGVLASLGATLTLPGIAGIVLTIGMAVDANVIIYERIREELAKGSGKMKAVSDGFSKSYSAIIDANLTTLITAIILAYFGLGPVLGFATVLIIGIFSSLFTAVLLTKLVIDWRMNGQPDAMAFSNSYSANRFKNSKIDFISKRKITYILSGVLIAAGILSMAVKGFDYGVDFSGGRTYMVRFDKDVSTEDISSQLKNGLKKSPLVRTFGESNQVMITTDYEITSNDKEIDQKIERIIYNGVKSNFTTTPSFDTFIKDHKLGYNKVGPTIADDISRGAKWATIFALIGIFLYILIRFKGWNYATAAVVTIIHDTMILLGIFSLLSGVLPFSLEINQSFIAALLTVIGYSINDTVVVFDRIREYVREHSKSAFFETVNNAVNSTLSRTIITSLTTLLVVLILFVFGGEVTRGFAFALLIGIIVGTYSSIFIATPIMVDLEKRANKSAKEIPAKQRKRAS